MDLKGKRILITGSASGIGEATYVLLYELGAECVLLDKAYGMDLTTMDINSYMLSIGKLDGFVHCAGVPYVSPLKTLDMKRCFEVYHINTIAALEIAKGFINKKVCPGEGSIVFISSDHALVGSGMNTGYAASKAALHGITKTLAIELAPRIRVNCIAPGFIRTPMADKITPMFGEGYIESVTKLYPLGLGEPEDVAHAIVYLLSARWVTGTILTVDGGYTAQ